MILTEIEGLPYEYSSYNSPYLCIYLKFYHLKKGKEKKHISWLGVTKLDTPLYFALINALFFVS